MFKFSLPTVIAAILSSKFKGKKTYTTAIVAIVAAVAAYFMGDATVMASLQMIITGVLGVTIRAAITGNELTIEEIVEEVSPESKN